LKNHCFAIPKVVWQEFVGEVGTVIFFHCQVSLGCCIPKIITIGRLFMELNKVK